MTETDIVTQQKVKELVDSWRKAEDAIKFAEMTSGDLVLPAVMELRYSGRKIIELLSGYILKNVDDENRNELFLEQAIALTDRARFDAIDSVIDHHISEFKKLNIHGNSKVEGIAEVASELAEIKYQIIEARESRINKLEIYNKLNDEKLMRRIVCHGFSLFPVTLLK